MILFSQQNKLSSTFLLISIVLAVFISLGIEENWVAQHHHYDIFSLLPALLTLLLCATSKNPLFSLLGGVIVGSVLLGGVLETSQLVFNHVAEQGGVGLLLVYVLLLGGLLGVWAKTGAAEAFATYLTQHFVKGPRSAKMMTWLLGIFFFQGGTLSTVLVGSSMRPVADKAKVSHEEMSYIVDSTASPIAAIIAFNAWPVYVQALIFVPGVSFLATESDRIAFFFASIPFSFYAFLAVLGTLLLSLNITLFSGKLIKKARLRALNTGMLDDVNAKPLNTNALTSTVKYLPYNAHPLEFVLPIVILIGVAVLTLLFIGQPKVEWAFGSALVFSALVALCKKMPLKCILLGVINGFSGVFRVLVILFLAVILGVITKALGGGLYLMSQLGDALPFLWLPIALQLMTMIIAFASGSSWGTYAIVFPLTMPLAWFIGEQQAIANIELFMMICFATVLNGSIFGDQCSPISDTTIMSAMSTGCDLIDHVKSQLFPASLAAILAGFLWTLSVYFLV